MARGKYSPQVVSSARRRAEMLQDRADGLTFEAIAAKHGVSRRRVRQIIDEEYARLGEARADMAQAQAQVILDRLEELWDAYRDEALNGDLKAAEFALKVADRAARLVGADAPAKIRAEGVVAHLPLAALREQAAALGLIEREESLIEDHGRDGPPVTVEVTVKSTESATA